VLGGKRMAKRAMCTLAFCAVLFCSASIDLTLSDAAVPHDSSYVFLQSWGNEIGVFHHPMGMAVDGANIYVCDTGGDRIQMFDLHGTPLSTFGELGTEDGQFYHPRDIAVDGDGNIYVADTDNHRIQKFTSDGTFLAEWGSEGSGERQFEYPRGITVDGNGDVYVADAGNYRVQKFTSSGTFLAQWGQLGSREGQFYEPSSIAVDRYGRAYVVDAGNDRIQVFAPDYPSPDPVYGLALNGSFEETPDLVHWTYGGELPVGLVNEAFHGAKAARLGEPTPRTEHEQGMAWLHQTIYIRPEWERPILTFHYRMFVNDIIHYSDFHVWLPKSNGAWLAEIKRDGFRSCCDPPLAPPPGYDLGWRTASYDLSAFKGQTVRLVFENRNLHGGYSWGIWTYLDDVRVVDAGPLPTPPGPPRAYLPVVTSNPPCDPVVGGLGIKTMASPRRP
jgi:hypothetical protein